MKLYIISTIVFFLLWLIASTLYSGPVWWSIFSSDRSTHTPLSEQVSIVKVTFAALVLLGIGNILKRQLQK